MVLAGGRASRFGGRDKTAELVGGRTLLDHVLGALGAAAPVVVVGPRRDTRTEVTWVREDPPGGGPVAALAAGLRVIDTAATVAVLAGDLAGVTEATLDRLRAAVGALDGAVLVDQDGREQWLLGVWRAGALRAVLPADPAGAAVRRVLGGLRYARVAALPGESVDVDTPADLDRVRSSQPSHR